jgi:hypothetical protein
VKLWRENESPFHKYKELRKENWVRFVEKCEPGNFAQTVSTCNGCNLRTSLTTTSATHGYVSHPKFQISKICQDNAFKPNLLGCIACINLFLSQVQLRCLKGHQNLFLGSKLLDTLRFKFLNQILNSLISKKILQRLDFYSNSLLFNFIFLNP